MRFGDPEAQVVLPLLDEPLGPVLARAASGQKLPTALGFSRDVTAGVVLASGGYPGPLDTGHEIHGLDRVRAECSGVAVRCAGISARGAALVVSGGRVLTVVGRAASYAEAIAAAYDAVGRIHFRGMQYRTDIGARALTGSPG